MGVTHCLPFVDLTLRARTTLRLGRDFWSAADAPSTLIYPGVKGTTAWVSAEGGNGHLAAWKLGARQTWKELQGLSHATSPDEDVTEGGGGQHSIGKSDDAGCVMMAMMMRARRKKAVEDFPFSIIGPPLSRYRTHCPHIHGTPKTFPSVIEVEVHSALKYLLRYYLVLSTSFLHIL